MRSGGSGNRGVSDLDGELAAIRKAGRDRAEVPLDCTTLLVRRRRSPNERSTRRNADAHRRRRALAPTLP